MEIRIVSAVDKAAVELIRRGLEEAGHTVTIGLNDVVASPIESTGSAEASCATLAGLVIAVAESDTDPACVVRLWAELTEAERQGLPILGVKTSESDIPPAVAALPHTGEWIYVQPGDGIGCAELLGAVTALSHGPGANAHTNAAPPAPLVAKVRSRAERIRHRLPRRSSEPPAEDERASRGRVFLAYSTEDSRIVDDICNRLDREGYRYWRDTTSIPGGAQWRDEIAGAISKADFVLVLLSSNVIKKPHYPKIELDIADSRQKKIIPILLEDLPLPLKGFEYALAGQECIALYHHNYERGIRQLFAALGHELGHRSGVCGNARWMRWRKPAV
jgi:TIR domain